MDAQRSAFRLIEMRKHIEHFQAGARRRLSVVFLGNRCPKQRHDGITDKFVDGAAVTMNTWDERIEAPIHHAPHLLRIEGLRHGGEAGDVGKHDCDQFAFTYRTGRGLAQRL